MLRRPRHLGRTRIIGNSLTNNGVLQWIKACTIQRIARYYAPRWILPLELNAMMGEFRVNDAGQTIDELRRQYNELAELAGSLAHEIKNPLSVIHMNADLLCEELEESQWPGQRRAISKVDMIRQQCNRLDNLLRDFLRFARMRDLEMTPGSLNDQIESVLLLYQAQADRSLIRLQKYLDPNLPLIKLHSDSLQAALLNLVKNAMEAMPDGGELLVRTYIVPGGVAMDMIDTGCGMDEVTAMRMFEPFYSTKHGGSGLGLPTARKIIEAHGGRIAVQSEVGRGTKFVLEFPTPIRLGI